MFEFDYKWLKDKTKINERKLSSELKEGRIYHRDYCLKNDEFENIIREFTGLHTISHLLMKEISITAGYSESSLIERLYFDKTENSYNVGIFLYCLGNSASGSLGGLSSQGSAGRLEEILNSVFEKRLKSCSADPICCDHEPMPFNPNGSACHLCCLSPETSCEIGNNLLDRNSIIL